ncbi:hypothetical protein D3C72_954410 [compost metagenome]
MIRRLIVPLLAVTVSTSCVSRADYDAKVQEVKHLKSSLEATKRELDDLKFGASRLYQLAKSDLEQGEPESAIRNAKALLEKHPATAEAKQATLIVSTAQAQLKKQEEAKRLAEDKAKREAEAKKKAEQARLAQALSSMRKKHDDIKGITWYTDKSTPKYYSERSDFHLYIGKNNHSKPWLRMVIQYTNDDWLFIQRYIIKADGQTFEITPEPFKGVERDNGGGDIWEWYDISAGDRELEIAKAIANSKKAVIRYDGKQYYNDRTISTREKQAIKNVLAAHEILSKE